VESHGMVVDGRYLADLQRTLKPYLKRLVSLAPTESYFAGL
jgi:hypothetical protein